MKKVVYDIESLPNFFCATFGELDGDGLITYEISERKNDYNKILTMIRNYKLIAYNGHGYDDILMNFLIENPSATERDINILSQKIIQFGRDWNNQILKAEIKRYKHQKHFQSIDVMTMLASSKLRVSLKHLQVITKWHNVEEFECDWKANLPKERWESCIKYCENDVLSLKQVCKSLKKDFELRDYVFNETGINVFSKDPVKIAEATMTQAIMKEVDPNNQLYKFHWETVEKNIPLQSLDLKDIILPFIKFETKEFQDVLKIYQNFNLNPQQEARKRKKDKFKIPTIFNGVIYNFGLGGLHHDYKKSLVHKPPSGYKLIQSDVTSYYPSMRIKHFKHRFDPAFLVEYKKAYEEKAEGKRTKNKMLESYAKLKLNSVFGLYNSVYSPLYAPNVAYSTTINGQLMLAMLIEKLHINGFKVIGANTDAVNVLVKKDHWNKYLSVCNEWENVTQMQLDHEEFKVIYEQSCNNYIAVSPEGKVKTKGSFVPELNMLKGYEYPIVKTALLEYFVNGIPLEDTIKNHDDIYDFCMSTKMGRSKKANAPFEAYHRDIKLQKTNRYYAGKGPESAYLYKRAGDVEQHVLKSSGVIIFNKYVEKEMKDYNINYDFYIREARKVQRAIEPEQLNLFE